MVALWPNTNAYQYAVIVTSGPRNTTHSVYCEHYLYRVAIFVGLVLFIILFLIIIIVITIFWSSIDGHFVRLP